MKTTITIAGNLGISPFNVFEQDIDEVILLLNYYLLIGAETPTETMPATLNDKDESEAFWALL